MTCEAQRGISHADVLHLLLSMLKMLIFALAIGEILAASVACAFGLIELWHAVGLTALSGLCIALIEVLTWKEGFE